MFIQNTDCCIQSKTAHTSGYVEYPSEQNSPSYSNVTLIKKAAEITAKLFTIPCPYSP